MRTIYAFYSAKQAKLTGTAFYRTLDGKEVEVTEVCSEDRHSNWDDIISLGKVISVEDGGYSRKGQLKNHYEFEGY